MARVLAAHQPNYLPWLGVLDRAARADVFVLADDVQYSTHGYTNRNRIRTADGWQWLTVPVMTRGRAGQRVRDVVVEEGRRWPRKHMESLRWNYGRAPHFEEHEGALEEIYGRSHRRLLDWNLDLFRWLMDRLDIGTEVRLSSQLGSRAEGTRRIADMAAACACDVYLAGDGGSRSYLDEAVMREAGVEVRHACFEHPRYPQCFPGFEPGMCGLDLLFNCGPRSREILRP